MSTIVPFSYKYAQWLALGGQSTPGVTLYNAAAYLLGGYLIQVKGVAIQTKFFNDGSTPTLTVPDSNFAEINDYTFSNQLLAGITCQRSPGLFNSPGPVTIWPFLVTTAQFGLMNLGSSFPASPPTPLTGRLCLWFNPIIFDVPSFLIQGYIIIR